MTRRLPRRRARARLAVASFAAAASLAFVASAQPGARRPAQQETSAKALRRHTGTEVVARLVQSADAGERLRGIERAASIGSPEAIAVLVDALERAPHIRADARAMLTMARALSRLAHHERARAGLLVIVGSSGPEARGRSPAPRGSAAAEDSAERAELARGTAALALARSGDDRALESLYAKARAGGNGQAAALLALRAHPPREPGFFGTANAPVPASVIRLIADLGDLRALDVLHVTARSTDAQVKAAALLALAELGDHRAAALARAALHAPDVRLRAAGAEALVVLGAPDRGEAVAALLSDDATAAVGLALAERAPSPALTAPVAARALQRGRAEERAAAIRALGRSPDPAAAQALARAELIGDGELSYLALSALARSPAPNAGALIVEQLAGRARSLAARAYVVRALTRGERLTTGDEALAALARSRDARERALGAFARVALEGASAAELWSDPDAGVRRAAAMGTLARQPSRESARALLGRVADEPDEATRQILSAGLLGGDPDATVKTSTLVELVESGGGGAPLAAFALARRADERSAARIAQLLRSSDALVRAHAARGLARAELPDATGRLANAYASEAELEVRRAIVTALAARGEDASVPARRKTLEIAADVDPDPVVRAAARRGLAGRSPMIEAAEREVAWIRVAHGGSEATAEPFSGAVLRSDGVAVPFAFDDEGHALVPLPPGPSRVVLAPRLPTYETERAP